jgi:signal transduction histidine kinase
VSEWCLFWRPKLWATRVLRKRCAASRTSSIPQPLTILGVTVALHVLTQEFQTGRRSTNRLCLPIACTIPTGIALVFYRITQEALRNIANHAGKGPMAVMLTATPTELLLTVKDAGSGFNPALTVKRRGGQGPWAKSMEERAQLVGGIVGYVRTGPRHFNRSSDTA